MTYRESWLRHTMLTTVERAPRIDLGYKEMGAIRTIRPSILPGEGGEIISLCGATPRMIIRLLRPLPEGAR